MRFFLLLFITVPIVEILILFQVSEFIGVLPTMAVVILTAVIGVNMLRQQGASTLLRANKKLAQGNLPAKEIVEGIILAMGGALLLTPGFFTDVMGVLCLLPQSRGYIAAQLLAKGVLTSTPFNDFSQGGFSGFNRPDNDIDDIIEGECQPIIKDRLDKQ